MHPGGGHVVTSPSSFTHSTTGRGHSLWSPAVGHTPGGVHSTFGDAGHHFDATHWTSGHFGDLHHFSPIHHIDHHFFDHHDFHHGHGGFVGLGFGFYGSSYPYYYNYPAAYPPSYYETPVYPDTNAPPVTGTPTAYAAAQRASAATETRFPDVAMPRMELPSGQAPEALPDETTSAPGRAVPPPESPRKEGSKQ